MQGNLRPCILFLFSSRPRFPSCASLPAKSAPAGETAAFGDNYNDMEMLHMAKYAWAMGKADDVIKQAAGRTCSRVEPVLQSILDALEGLEQ